jgi:hypothetical protein
MLKTFAIALVAAGLIAAPALAQKPTNAPAPAAQTQVKQVKPAKVHAQHATKSRVTHRTSRKHHHVRHARLHKPAVKKAG